MAGPGWLGEGTAEGTWRGPGRGRAATGRGTVAAPAAQLGGPRAGAPSRGRARPRVTPGRGRGALRGRAQMVFVSPFCQVSAPCEGSRGSGSGAPRKGISSACPVGFAGMLDVEFSAYFSPLKFRKLTASSFYSKNRLFLFERSTRTSRVSVG